MNVGKNNLLKSTVEMEKIKKDLIKRKIDLEAQLAELNEDQSTPQDVTGQDIGDQTISSIIEFLEFK